LFFRVSVVVIIYLHCKRLPELSSAFSRITHRLCNFCEENSSRDVAFKQCRKGRSWKSTFRVLWSRKESIFKFWHNTKGRFSFPTVATRAILTSGTNQPKQDSFSSLSPSYKTPFHIMALVLKLTIIERHAFCEISGSHGGEYEDDCLLGCCAV
jgi:hypothetical protein